MEQATLPKLSYENNALEPYYDAQTVEIHHSKHHAGYVKGFNNAQEKLAQARESNDYTLVKHYEHELAFHGAGHRLHSLFWENMRAGKDVNEPSEQLKQKLANSFGSYEAFVAQFKKATATVEGSGWGALVSHDDGSMHILAIHNHQNAFIPGCKVLLVCDVWEHAYYLKFQNKRAEWIENFMHIINWDAVEQRL